MNQQTIIDRRTAIKAAGAAIGMSLVAGAAEEPKAVKPALSFRNEEFYKDGKFNAEAAKDAVIKVMQYHGYPVFKGVREKLWVSDYGLGQFAQAGLAAWLIANNEKDRYMILEIYLLPNQMLPEHWHEATDKNPAKLEGWFVRYGLSHIVGEGEPNLGPDVVIPKCHMNGTATTRHEVVAGPGDFVPVVRVTSRHWQLAGPEGAIITEVANVHDNAGVRHSDPKIVFP